MQSIVKAAVRAPHPLGFKRRFDESVKRQKTTPPGNAPALLAGALAPVIYSLVYYKYLEHRGQLENGSPNGDRELNGNT